MSITDKYAPLGKDETVAGLKAENERMRAALAKIERWFGEFPPTGITCDDGPEMTYGAAYGSNGERDYMRAVARRALDGEKR